MSIGFKFCFHNKLELKMLQVNTSTRFEWHKIFCFKLFNDYFISLRILMNVSNSYENKKSL